MPVVRGQKRFGDLARAISRERQRIYNIGFLQRPATVIGSSGEFHVLRRWNSFTPLTSQTAESIGGGYLLLWNGKAIIIDPGYAFMSLYTKHYSMLDLACVIVTHDHPDHCEDLLKILTLLRELNEMRENKGDAPHRLRVFLSYGAYFKSSVLLQNEQIAPYIDCYKVMPPCRFDLRSDLGLIFSATVCQHNEILGDSTTFGVRLGLYQNRLRCTVGITSDTGYRPDIAKQFDLVDLLMLHIGAMEDPGSKHLLGSHLGTRGVRRLLADLAHLPRLVVLTEWGEEFYGKRVAVCDYISSFFPNHSIIPGDLLLRIRLPSCDVGLWPEQGFLHPSQIQCHDDGSNILYTRMA